MLSGLVPPVFAEAFLYVLLATALLLIIAQLIRRKKWRRKS